jgi:signal transduction histidine kinase
MLSATLGAGLPTGAAESFTASMAEGLHALAQPLTILRNTVALMAAPKIAEAARQRYLDLSSEQVQRACELFEMMQDLVIVSQVEAVHKPFELAELVSAVVDDPHVGLETSGVTINVVVPGDLPPILGDYARTIRALAAALKITTSLSSPGGPVEVRASPSGSSGRLTVTNPRPHGRTLNSSQRLALSLIEANIRSQRGRYTFAEDPFCVSMELPFAA